MLIRDGALPLTVLDDILADLGVEKQRNSALLKDLGEDERKIVSCLQEEGEMSLDALCRKLYTSAGKISGIVTVLELKGVVHTALGKVFLAK